MFGRKQRIIETQKALIADLKEDLKKSEDLLEKAETVIDLQNKRLFKLIEVNSALKACINASNIDFPNSQKGGSDHTGAVNVSDILNL